MKVATVITIGVIAGALTTPSVDARAFNGPQEVEEQTQHEQRAARAAVKAGDVMPYAKLKKKIEKETGGRIIGQRLRKTGHGWLYELRLRMKKGHIRYVMVEGATGKIIRRAG